MNKFGAAVKKVFDFSTETEEFELLPKEDVGQKTNPVQEPMELTGTLEEKLNDFKDAFRKPTNSDLKIRSFKIGKELSAHLLFIDGMADRSTINEFIIKPCMMPEALKGCIQGEEQEFLVNCLLNVNDIEEVSDFEKLKQAILDGLAVLIVDKVAVGLIIEVRGYDMRSVSTPKVETVVGGPQEAFTENLRTNITLIRRIVRDADLISEFMPCGGDNNTKLAVMYRDSLVDKRLLAEVKKRLSKISEHFVLGDGMVQQLIEERSFSLLPQVLKTERPDRTASYIMEGYIAIVVDGAPFAIITPMTFFSLFHASDDTYSRMWAGVFMRVIRMMGLLCCIFLPSLYIGVMFFHQELVPTELLESILASRVTVAIPLVAEMLAFTVTFELVREAGVRAPGSINQTIGVVGGLILGQAAVSASIVSPIMIIVVAVTGLGNYVIPNYDIQMMGYLLRIVFIIIASFSGLIGISIGFVVLLAYMCSIKSFGVPYFAPYAPQKKHTNDLFLRGTLKKGTAPSQFVGGK